MFEKIINIMYLLSLIYFFYCEISYFFYKIKKDVRFKDVGFFKYLGSPIKILKGDK